MALIHVPRPPERAHGIRIWPGFLTAEDAESNNLHHAARRDYRFVLSKLTPTLTRSKRKAEAAKYIREVTAGDPWMRTLTHLDYSRAGRPQKRKKGDRNCCCS